MATLAGQRAQFTWALNQYNLAEDAEKQAYYAIVGMPRLIELPRYLPFRRYLPG
jgi:hypothetical protein